jgi:hypothetical protein
MAASRSVRADPLQYLCVGERSAGLHYDSQANEWQPQAFSGHKYIFRRLNDDDRDHAKGKWWPLTATCEPNVRALLSTALDTALALRNPSPPPEPTIVVVQEDDGSADLGNPNFGVEQEAPFLVLTILLRPDESTGTAQVAPTADLPVR